MKTIKSLLLSMTLFLSSCQGVSEFISFQPVGTPIKISIDSTGQVSFELENEIEYPTVIGTFSAGVVLDPAAYYQKKSTLTVRIDCKDQFYDLNGRDFSVDFDSGYYEKIDLTKRRNNIFLTVNRIGTSWVECPPPVYTSDVISNIRMSNDSSERNITTTFSPREPVYLFFDINDLTIGDEIGIMMLEQVTDPSDPAPRVEPGDYIPDDPSTQTFIYDGGHTFYIYWPDGYQGSEGGHFMIEIFINGFKVGEKQFDVR